MLSTQRERCCRAFASGSFDGSATASGSTTLTPIRVTQSEPSAAAQLLRGVHDHKSVYTLTVDNNRVLPSAGLALEEYLPAGLDTRFPTLTNPCVVPSTVETVNLDPDGSGPLPPGVYTDVIWNATDLGALADQVASGTFSIDFAVAVPLRENTLFPNGTATDGVQGSNLDNNTGALTTDEQVLSDRAIATGTTGGVTTSVGANRTVTAEDLATQSSVDVGTIRPGAISTWTTRVQTSEYARNTSSIAMTDLVPDGLCVIAPGTACAASGASPTPAPASVNGSAPTTVVWNLAPLPPNATARRAVDGHRGRR